MDAAVQKTNQTKYMPEVEDIAHCPDSFLPDILWENSTIESFSNLRLVCIYPFLCFNAMKNLACCLGRRKARPRCQDQGEEAACSSHERSVVVVHVLSRRRTCPGQRRRVRGRYVPC